MCALLEFCDTYQTKNGLNFLRKLVTCSVCRVSIRVGLQDACRVISTLRSILRNTYEREREREREREIGRERKRESVLKSQ